MDDSKLKERGMYTPPHLRIAAYKDFIDSYPDTYTRKPTVKPLPAQNIIQPKPTPKPCWYCENYECKHKQAKEDRKAKHLKMVDNPSMEYEMEFDHDDRSTAALSHEVLPCRD